MMSNQELDREQHTKDIPKLKIRVQGTKEDIEWFNNLLEKSYVKIISTSPMFSNKGTVRYFREYIDVRTGGQIV